MSVEERLTLADWRRQIAELYAEIRRAAQPDAAWRIWRETRDRMFRDHPQSPLPDERRAGFGGLSYFDYDPRARVVAEVSDAPPERFEIPTSGGTPMTFDRVGTAGFTLYGRELTLDVYWLDTYGGGLFVPFKDATSGRDTYGAGRYLIDSIKGADLGRDAYGLVLDFNFAYNPSCSYDSRWVCPLAPPANRLDVAVRAGERVT